MIAPTEENSSGMSPKSRRYSPSFGAACSVCSAISGPPVGLDNQEAPNPNPEDGRHAGLSPAFCRNGSRPLPVP